jgi:hypothetical protein
VSITSWKDYGGFNPPSGHEQQGRLFRISPEQEGLAARHRYPRGYTPERQAEISRAIVPGSVSAGAGVPASRFTIDARDAWFRPDPTSFATHGKKWQRPTPEITPVHDEIARRRIIDTLARSHIPAEHLNPAPTFEITRPFEGREALGTYRTPAKAVPKTSAEESVQALHDARFKQATSGGQIHLLGDPRQGRQMEGTLLHELGHHHSYQTGTEHSEYLTEGQMGREEAYADEYAGATHVPRRGEGPLDRVSAYENRRTWAGMRGVGDSAYAHQQYQHARLMAKMERGEPVGPQTPAPYQEPAYQGRLFARPVDTRFTSTEGDYGQWGYTHPDTNERLETVGLPPPSREQRMKGGHPFTAEDLGTPENPSRELTKPTLDTLRQHWGQSAMDMDPTAAVQRWGREHPELRWGT